MLHKSWQAPQRFFSPKFTNRCQRCATWASADPMTFGALRPARWKPMENDESTAQALILIVDDDPVECFLMRETLESAGFAVIEASDGIEGCQRYEKHHPDLLLVDIMMPRMDGYELC